MKNIFILSCLFLSMTLFAQKQEPSFLKSFPVSGEATLSLQTAGGSLTVEEGSTNEITVEFFVRKRGRYIAMSMDELKQHKDISINQDGSNVQVKIKNKNKSNWKKSYNVSMKAYAPKATQVSLMTSGGAIKVKELNGDHDVMTSGGSIELTSIVGDVRAVTAGGAISCESINGDVNAQTSGGSLRFQSITGAIQGTTAGGSIKLLDVAGKAKVSTAGGSITGVFTDVTGAISMSTSGGSVSLDVPDDLGMNLKASGGNVMVEMNDFNGKITKRSAKGQVNGGGIDVSCHTTGGSVKVY